MYTYEESGGTLVLPFYFTKSSVGETTRACSFTSPGWAGAMANELV